MGREEAEKSNPPPVPYIYISITDNPCDSVNSPLSSSESCKGYLHKSFLDMEQEIPAVTLNLGYESSHFTSEDAKEVANFILKNWRNVELVIFQCEEGISRSAGMAMATDEAFNNNAYDIANTPPFCPNMLVYKLMKEEFKIR